MKLAGGLVLVAVVDGEEQLYSAEAGLSGLRHQRAATGAALVFLQQPLRRLPGVPRPGQQWTSIRRKVIVDWSKPLLDGGLGPGRCRT